MSDIVIRVENLGKKYIIGHQANRHRTLRDVLGDAVSFRRFRNPKSEISNPTSEPFWALKNVSFEVARGEVVGIIGRNGAGKSTLLKILSRITEPTTGRVRIRGRVASLLEVGTGFHPELTGRENVFLNGAILGMTREEIKRKFDEIVAFAEVEKFLDTPVKRYSSGMYVRLAFAVAAHLEPEILIVDEVLAVGDAQFQKKCLGKMGEVSREGRTVLFVSHSMPAVTRLCRRGILLDYGEVTLDSNMAEVSSRYLQSELGTSAERYWDDMDTAPGDSGARLKAVRVISDDTVNDTVDIRSSVTIEMEYWNLKPDARLVSVFSFMNDQGIVLFVAADFQEQDSLGKPVGVFRSRCTVPGNLFAEGQVRVVAEVSTRHPAYQIHFLEFDSMAFQVVDKGQAGSVRANWGRHIPGVVRPSISCETEYVGTLPASDNSLSSDKLCSVESSV
jgi:lipopolysaccharide transport system ATP-binding protein